MIFESEGTVTIANNINSYLVDAVNVFIESRTKPICDVPDIGIGNKPIDGGNYLFSEQEKDEFLKIEPQAEKWFRPWVGADEFINRYRRYCLWLGDCPPLELKNMPEARKRIDAVRQFRLASKSAQTKKLAEKPRRFHVENMPQSNYIVIPEVSSERRKYIPIGFLTPDVLCSNLVKIIPKANPYHFGILTSNIHMAWVRAVCGRLKSDYRYSKDIVYNNFPWPDHTDEQKAAIEKAAQGVLDAREIYPDESFANLYDPDCMPEELWKAHNILDKAVKAAYGGKGFAAETERVGDLMERYAELVK